ncbi:MAG: DUF2147 domain-containing protein [Burkholderiales bacterium]|nr:MAG: DUF2147 domain-containing protein [Burkholderiales bacterium]
MLRHHPTPHRLSVHFQQTPRLLQTAWRGAPWAAIVLLAGATAAQAQALGSLDPRGRWITANGNLEVEIAPCGKALCGQVTKVLGNRSMSGDGPEMDPVDKRPALGMTLLRDFQPMLDHETGETTGQWSGEIYNRENGKTYHCLMSVSTASKPAGELVLRAYMGLPLFGKTLSWARATREPAAALSQPSSRRQE